MKKPMVLVEPRAIRTHNAATVIQQEADSLRNRTDGDRAALRLASMRLNALARSLRAEAKYLNHPPGCNTHMFGYDPEWGLCTCGRDPEWEHPNRKEHRKRRTR